jgi:hypothetical protein
MGANLPELAPFRAPFHPLNHVDESTHIQRLGLNLGRRTIFKL